MFVCAPFFTMPNTLKPKLTTRCILYLYFLPHFESFTTSLFYLFDFKSNFTTTNMFLLYFCCVLQSTSIIFGPCWSHLVHSVYFGPIQSTLVLFGPLCPLSSYSVHLVLFNPLCFYLVQFGSIQSILFTLVLSIHICSIGSI